MSLALLPFSSSASPAETTASWNDSEAVGTDTMSSGVFDAEVAAWTGNQNLDSVRAAMRTRNVGWVYDGTWTTDFAPGDRRAAQFVIRSTQDSTHHIGFDGNNVDISYTGQGNPNNWRWWIFGVYTQTECSIATGPEVVPDHVVASADSLDYSPAEKTVGTRGVRGYGGWDPDSDGNQRDINGWNGVCFLIERKEGTPSGDSFEVTVNANVGTTSAVGAPFPPSNGPGSYDYSWSKVLEGFVYVSS